MLYSVQHTHSIGQFVPQAVTGRRTAPLCHCGPAKFEPMISRTRNPCSTDSTTARPVASVVSGSIIYFGGKKFIHLNTNFLSTEALVFQPSRQFV